MNYEIKHSWNDTVIWAGEIPHGDGSPIPVKLGAAVRLAVASDADLRGASLSGADLRDADLRDADLSGADLSDADLRGADLRGADLSGADLSGADLSDADLRDASLRDASLRGASLRGASLRGASLRDADLRGANLRGASLRGADLSDADLSGASLRGADLSDADLRDVPIIPEIHKAVYGAASQPEALDMGTWHRACGTTHCRAGWVCTLAGKEGMALEHKIGTPAAAALIYFASDPTLNRVPDFYCSNETALADMKCLAESSGAE